MLIFGLKVQRRYYLAFIKMRELVQEVFKETLVIYYKPFEK